MPTYSSPTQIQLDHGSRPLPAMAVCRRGGGIMESRTGHLRVGVEGVFKSDHQGRFKVASSRHILTPCG